PRSFDRGCCHLGEEFLPNVWWGSAFHSGCRRFSRSRYSPGRGGLGSRRWIRVCLSCHCWCGLNYRFCRCCRGGLVGGPFWATKIAPGLETVVAIPADWPCAWNAPVAANAGVPKTHKPCRLPTKTCAFYDPLADPNQG